MSVYVVRAFIQMREQLAVNREILKRLMEIDKTLLQHDSVLRDIYRKLLPLLHHPANHQKGASALARLINECFRLSLATSCAKSLGRSAELAYTILFCRRRH
jgi:hypothetical protein